MNKLLAFLAIFCIIVSAGVVCAADLDGFATSGFYQTGTLGSSSSVDLGDGIQYTPNGPEPGAGLPLENQTASGPMNVSHNASVNAKANVTANATGNATSNVTSNVTANATHNSTNATPNPASLLATGNPIIVLLVMIAAVGGYAFLRRNR